VIEVIQADREAAAAKIKGDGEKSIDIRSVILAGKADGHPAVQGAAFYRADRNHGN
jgi:hypothetical protein